MTRRAKKARPSFDVARAEIGGQGARWVYRSDAPSEVAAPPVKRPVPAVESRVESLPERPARPIGLRASKACQSESSKSSSAHGWIEIGVSVMTMPLTLPILAMIAPVIWFAGSRPRR